MQRTTLQKRLEILARDVKNMEHWDQFTDAVDDHLTEILGISFLKKELTFASMKKIHKAVRRAKISFFEHMIGEDNAIYKS